MPKVQGKILVNLNQNRFLVIKIAKPNFINKKLRLENFSILLPILEHQNENMKFVAFAKKKQSCVL